MDNMKELNKTIRQVMSEQNLDYDSDIETLEEVRFLRGASALVFASKSKQSGDKVVQNANRGKQNLKRVKRPNIETDEKIELLSEAIEDLFDTQIELRKQIGNLVGVALTSALISERSNKELTKMMKQSRSRR